MVKRHNTKIFIVALFSLAILASARVSISFAETGTSATSNTAANTTNTTSGTTDKGADANITTLVAPATQTLKTIVIDPDNIVVEPGSKISLKVRPAGSDEVISKASWSVYESNGGYINADGIYVAPMTPGVYHVIARYPGYYDRGVSITVKPKTIPTAQTVQTTQTTQTTITQTNNTTTRPATTSVSTPITATTTTTKTLPPPIVPTQVKAPVITPTNTTSSANATRTRDVPESLFEIRTSLPKASSTVASSTSASTTREVKEETKIQVQANLRDISTKIEDVKTSVTQDKERLIKIVDQRISEVMAENGLPENATSTIILKSIRDRLQNDLDSGLTSETATAPEKIKELGTKISDGLKEISKIVPTTATSSSDEASKKAADSLVSTLGERANDLKSNGGDLFYKDSNNDGISDYESLHVYNIDPVQPSPVTVAEDGRKINAGEKVLLGYDPSKAGLVKVEREEPKDAVAPIAPAYKVTEVKLAADTKKVVLKGQALPNSFITLYIYSTPIIVTVKTNSEGEWDYTLDKELETGEHTVYTASVNNTGNIVARSSGFTFVKTAEAATLDTNPAGIQASSEAAQPGILEGNNLYVIIVAFLAIVLVAIGLIGVTVR